MTEAMRLLGERIYEESLGDRRGFRRDQTGIDDRLWPEIYEEIGRAAMRHYTPAPEGWQLVPVEPTWHMLDDGWRMDGIDHARLERAYGAMLARAADPGFDDDQR